MEAFAKILSALASLAWPVAVAVLLFKLYGPIRKLVESASCRKFTLKVAGYELTMEELSEQQRVILNDLQCKVAELETRLGTSRDTRPLEASAAPASSKRILWVDDKPRNNSFLIAALEERGVRVETALNTDEGVEKFKKSRYDIVVSDMGRPEGEHAGLDLTRKIKSISPSTPVFIFCSAWAARNLRAQALSVGSSEITASGTTLLSALPLAGG